MKNWGFIVLAMMIASLTHQAFCQGILAPLYVFTDGEGSVTPYQSGQNLEVGQTYDLTATPDAGYQFSSWQPVDVFIAITTNYNFNGDPILPPIQSIVPSVVATNFYVSDLEFIMEEPEQISSDGSNPDIVEAFGWQADFVDVPEPAAAVIAVSGLATVGAARRRRQLRNVGDLKRLIVRDERRGKPGSFDSPGPIGSV